jgi:putative endonuclease
VARRLEQHNRGQGAKFTRGRGPWRLIHREGPMTRSEALKRELAIKRDPGFKAALKAAILPAPGA